MEPGESPPKRRKEEGYPGTPSVSDYLFPQQHSYNYNSNSQSSYGESHQSSPAPYSQGYLTPTDSFSSPSDGGIQDIKPSNINEMNVNYNMQYANYQGNHNYPNVSQSFIYPGDDGNGLYKTEDRIKQEYLGGSGQQPQQNQGVYVGPNGDHQQQPQQPQSMWQQYPQSPHMYSATVTMTQSPHPVAGDYSVAQAGSISGSTQMPSTFGASHHQPETPGGYPPMSTVIPPLQSPNMQAEANYPPGGYNHHEGTEFVARAEIFSQQGLSPQQAYSQQHQQLYAPQDGQQQQQQQQKYPYNHFPSTVDSSEQKQVMYPVAPQHPGNMGYVDNTAGIMVKQENYVMMNQQGYPVMNGPHHQQPMQQSGAYPGNGVNNQFPAGFPPSLPQMPPAYQYIPPSPSLPLPEQYVQIEMRLCQALSHVLFGPPVTHIYNPLEYAIEPHKCYLQKYCQSKKDILFLGMNPGPYGMAQTGVPFGEVKHAKEWLEISGAVKTPQFEHPKKPVLGFDCSRREVSGDRFWGFFKKLCITPDNFFRYSLVHNICPLLFMNEKGKNLTPSDLKLQERKQLNSICGKALCDIVQLLEVKVVIGVGRFSEERAKVALKDCGIEWVKVTNIMHPSPANPAANKGWDVIVERQLDEMGLTNYFRAPVAIKEEPGLSQPLQQQQQQAAQAGDGGGQQPVVMGNHEIGSQQMGNTHLGNQMMGSNQPIGNQQQQQHPGNPPSQLQQQQSGNLQSGDPQQTGIPQMGNHHAESHHAANVTHQMATSQTANQQSGNSLLDNPQIGDPQKMLESQHRGNSAALSNEHHMNHQCSEKVPAVIEPQQQQMKMEGAGGGDELSAAGLQTEKQPSVSKHFGDAPQSAALSAGENHMSGGNRQQQQGQEQKQAEENSQHLVTNHQLQAQSSLMPDQSVSVPSQPSQPLSLPDHPQMAYLLQHQQQQQQPEMEKNQQQQQVPVSHPQSQQEQQHLLKQQLSHEEQQHSLRQELHQTQQHILQQQQTTQPYEQNRGEKKSSDATVKNSLDPNELAERHSPSAASREATSAVSKVEAVSEEEEEEESSNEEEESADENAESEETTNNGQDEKL